MERSTVPRLPNRDQLLKRNRHVLNMLWLGMGSFLFAPPEFDSSWLRTDRGSISIDRSIQATTNLLGSFDPEKILKLDISWNLKRTVDRINSGAFIVFWFSRACLHGSYVSYEFVLDRRKKAPSLLKLTFPSWIVLVKHCMIWLLINSFGF